MDKSLFIYIYLGAVLAPRFVFHLVLLFIATVVGLIGFKRLTNPYKIITILTATVFISECLTRFFIHHSGNSFPVYHVLILVEIILYLAIYLELFKDSKTVSLIIKLVALAALALSVINTLYIQPITTFPSNGVLSLSTLLVTCVLLQFFFMLKNPSPLRLVKQPVFWFNCGNLFFYCITFFIFGFLNPWLKTMEKPPEWGFDVIWLSNVIMYGSYTIALYLQVKEKKDLSL